MNEVNKKYNKYELTGEYGIGYDSKGNEFYFDLEDYDKIKDYYWYNRYGYFSNETINGKIYLHKLIMNVSELENMVIDHINRQRNDNRKCNLRLATVIQNSYNANIPKDNTSGYIGITWDKSRNKWIAGIKVNYKRINLGRYHDIEDAIKVRLKAEKQYFGEFAPQIHLFEQYGII